EIFLITSLKCLDIFTIVIYSLYYPFVDNLVIELEDRLVIANGGFKVQYLIPSLVHELTPAQEDAIFDAFHDDFSGDRKSFRSEFAVRGSLWKKQNTNKTLFPYIYIFFGSVITMSVSTASAERQFSIKRRDNQCMSHLHQQPR
ncbi:hypothetical protein MAR_038040, partial [Mya arenaria]